MIVDTLLGNAATELAVEATYIHGLETSVKIVASLAD